MEPLAHLPWPVRRSFESARTLTLVAIILYGIFAGIFLLLAGATAALIGAAAGIFLFFAFLPLLFLFLTYAYVYRPLKWGDLSHDPRAAALVLGILSILLAGVISGILLIVAYAKMSNGYTAMASPQTWSAPPTRSPPPPVRAPDLGASESPAAGEGGIRYCPSCGAGVETGSRFCVNCGARLPVSESSQGP